MKRLLRNYLLHLFGLWALTQILLGSFTITGGITTYLLAALILSAMNLLLKPILKLLFFPINALTLGLFSVLINAAIFYLFLRLVPQINLNPWQFPGLSLPGITVPAFVLNYWATLVIASILLTFITNFLIYLLK